MAEEQQPNAEAPEILVDVDATAERLTEIASQSLDTNEVARQIEELTSVVLDSAELATRAASLAADTGTALRTAIKDLGVLQKKQNKWTIILMASSGFLMLCLALLFAIMSMRIQARVAMLDEMLLAVGKRVTEMDASLELVGSANESLKAVATKQAEMVGVQAKLDEKLEQVRDFGMYRVQNAENGEQLVGWVLPVIDFEMMPLPMYIFATHGNYAVQDNIAGSRCGHDLDKFLEFVSGGPSMGEASADGGSNPLQPPPTDVAGSGAGQMPPGPSQGMPKTALSEDFVRHAAESTLSKLGPKGSLRRASRFSHGIQKILDRGTNISAMERAERAAGTVWKTDSNLWDKKKLASAPQGDGCFVSINNERATATPPLTIKATTTDAGGQVSYHCEDVWGQEVTLSISAGLEAIAEIGEGHYAIPDSLQFLPLQNPVHLVKDPMEMSKFAEAREVGGVGWLTSTGIGELSGCFSSSTSR